MNKVIFAWHVHHNILIELLTEPIENRIKYIKKFKPKNEIELRLKLLKVVKGELPKEFVEAWQEYNEARQKDVEAWQKYNEAWQKYYEARQKYDETWQKDDETWQEYDEAFQKYDEALQKYYEARQKYDEIWQEYYKVWHKYVEVYKKYEPQIFALHKKECPNCSWNGKTIFSKEVKA